MTYKDAIEECDAAWRLVEQYPHVKEFQLSFRAAYQNKLDLWEEK